MIEGWQWILLALIAIVTVGGFVGAAACEDYRASVWRWLKALFLPALWWCVVLYAMPHFPQANGIFVLLAMIGVMCAPAVLVFSIVSWVSWVMCPTNKSQSD